MKIEISEVAKAKINQCYDLLGEVMDDLKPDFSDKSRVEFDSKEEELRFNLSLLSMTDAIRGVKHLRHAMTMTDDEVREMCADADVTVSTAIENAKHNMVGQLLSDILGDIGMFTPPETDKED